MPEKSTPAAIAAREAPARIRPSVYPERFAERMQGRVKHPLGDLFGLANFGVNLTRLAPGAASALHHAHTKQDEFIYVLEGEPTLVTDEGEVSLTPGMCAGFAADGSAHHVHNRSDSEAVFLEIGDRSKGDTATYPDDDLAAEMGADGQWRFTRKDGTPY